jgi:hypothetical protein
MKQAVFVLELVVARNSIMNDGLRHPSMTKPESLRDFTIHTL